MSIEFLDSLKRRRDIRIKPKFSGGKTGFRCTPALSKFFFCFSRLFATFFRDFCLFFDLELKVVRVVGRQAGEQVDL